MRGPETDRRGGASLGLGFGLALDGAPADIVATETIRPANARDRSISARLSLANGLADGRDIEDAAAIGEDFAAVRFGAGVKNLDAFDGGGFIKSFDHRATRVLSRIALCRHHHGQRRVAIPAQVEALELTVVTCEQRRNEV